MAKEEFTHAEHAEHCRLAGCKHAAAIGPSQGWCDLCRGIAFRFDPTWIEFAEAGTCDAYGGMQYERVAKEWIAAARPIEIAAFIDERANEPPPKREAN